ncbi:MAG: hypothetical protein WC721_14745 [Victivallaceae bacterium]
MKSEKVESLVTMKTFHNKNLQIMPDVKTGNRYAQPVSKLSGIKTALCLCAFVRECIMLNDYPKCRSGMSKMGLV